MPETGKKLVIAAGVYLIAKSVLNLFLGGFGMGNLATLVLEAGFAAMLLFRVKYANWIVGILTLLMAAYYLPGNLSGLPGTWVYLAEALLDAGTSVMLFAHPDVKAYFSGNTQ